MKQYAQIVKVTFSLLHWLINTGKEVAKFCQVYFQQELVKMPEFYSRDFATALRKTFIRMDEMLEDEVWFTWCIDFVV
jgi:hypothetical protein